LTQEEVDLTPDPRVLEGLTHTPLKPIDALCELVDNALDSFEVARERGTPVEGQMVIITLPTASEVRGGGGIVRVRDNGLGLTHDEAERAMRAGFSGNNRHDRLGLFGMGFNIATGKIGRITRFVSARKDDEFALEVKIDLPAMQKRGHYRTPVTDIDKPEGMEHGTMIEVSDWWPQGNANAGFAVDLAGGKPQYSKPKMRELLGRRYARILKRKQTRMLLNGDICEPYYHCHWNDSRSVERQNVGTIPAVFRFNEVLQTQRRCTECDAQVTSGETCPIAACGSSSSRTIEERVNGWVGIQRFDDPNQYGIDLIRNGRAIRILEQDAFFTFVNEAGQRIRDYVIDGQYGRIIGEVELNHVPVDFMKQDFQRTSPEWARAMTFLRGDSSLQPRQEGADENKSPLYKLYQGYRRVRTFGRVDMYMGQWDDVKGKPARVSRDKETELYELFLAGAPGYRDDAEWWKLVENADLRPAEALMECPDCDAQNLKSAEECTSCGHIVRGKACTKCEKQLMESAASCPHCGQSQIPELSEPWECSVCKARNEPESTHCFACEAVCGAKHPLDVVALRSRSARDDSLSADGVSVPLADGKYSSPLKVTVYQSNDPLQGPVGGEKIPIYRAKTPETDHVEVFLDLSHEAFSQLKLSPHMFIASEVADHLFSLNQKLAGGKHEGVHARGMLQWQVINTLWRDDLTTSPASLTVEIHALFDEIRDRLASAMGEQSEEAFAELDENAQKEFVNSLLESGRQLDAVKDLQASGEFIRYVGVGAVLSIFRAMPAMFFDGRVWPDDYAVAEGLSEGVLLNHRKGLESLFGNLLEDCALFPRVGKPNDIIMTRAKAALEFLQGKLTP
jgi:hypothetical protein